MNFFVRKPIIFERIFYFNSYLRLLLPDILINCKFLHLLMVHADPRSETCVGAVFQARARWIGRAHRLGLHDGIPRLSTHRASDFARVGPLDSGLWLDSCLISLHSSPEL